MYTVEKYHQVRRLYFNEGWSKRKIYRELGIHRETTDKMLEHSVPPGYQRQTEPKKPKLDPFTGIIKQILEDDENIHRKQRHTAKRIFDRLREEYGFSGGYTIVKDFVRLERKRMREMFVPLTHPPGHAQADFGEADAVIAGQKRRIHFLVLSFPQSDAVFLQAYPVENTESFCEGHNAAFAFFGGVPQSVLYDNTRIAVTRIMRDGGRDLTSRFTELLSHYLYEPRFGRPGRGNDKGQVENLVGFTRRNFLVPIPHFESFEALNTHLEQSCRKRLESRLRGHKETVGERLQQDQKALLPLPPTPYDACERVSTQVSSLSLVRYRSSDYSVPTRYGYHDVLVRGYVHEVVISYGAEEIARHPRSYEKEDFVFNPLHYLALLERKIAALDQAAPLSGWELPEEFHTLRRIMEARAGKHGKREYVQILRLLEDFSLETVHESVQECLRMGAVSYDAVKHLVLCRMEKRPDRLDLERFPYLPRARVKTTSAAAYRVLFGGGKA